MSLPAKVNAFFSYTIHKEIFAGLDAEDSIKNSGARPHDNFSAKLRRIGWQRKIFVEKITFS